jgi:hypothetical protein
VATPIDPSTDRFGFPQWHLADVQVGHRKPSGGSLAFDCPARNPECFDHVFQAEGQAFGGISIRV